ncbi:SH3 domain-containing protein [Allokutzneria albata]|uniref:SH3 domain-containing protein n=1 Tax=Allokutzneria albata TaxID=211114 RepID=A0A1H0D6B5_ALLAB|nr:hypothetical protein [Allokutzneria albata]SDN65619.1 hypothetical protein SAMN04489726_7607 [Allokutzneria albata]
MRALAAKLTLATVSVALLGGPAHAQVGRDAAGVPGRFVADTEIVAAPGGAVVGMGRNGQRVTINCQAADRNWWHLNAPEAAGWVWQPGQVLREYGTPEPRIC